MRGPAPGRERHYANLVTFLLKVIVNLIGNTTTWTGLKVQAELDRAVYPTGVKVSDVDFAAVQLQPAAFHGPRWYA